MTYVVQATVLAVISVKALMVLVSHLVTDLDCEPQGSVALLAFTRPSLYISLTRHSSFSLLSYRYNEQFLSHL